ncbi:hypothetical protein [Winogradskyella helgolandensis]|uniref:hypothetical protein n=1 Tax=Winogradskyella helgolandensis TaxID=2697010 RepID=UPI0015BFE18A|nr:hypothetical protein [Winogradskyella helgolandensis]
MKNVILILSIIFSNLIFCQTEKCSVQEIQLETYEFVLNNLNRINKEFENKESLIEVSIDFKKHTPEQEVTKDYAEIKNTDYYLVSPENSYSGENKEKIKVYSKLDKLVVDKINNCISNSTEFKEHLYGNITFRIPLNKKNIGIAIEQVKTTIEE